jgi:hypothetical protein
MNYFLKFERGEPSQEVAEAAGKTILDRGRHEGRRVVEVYVVHAGGDIDRYEERTRRKLGSNAISSRTWLCQTLHVGGDAFADDRYIPNPEVEIEHQDPAPQAVVLVLTGAEHDTEQIVEQMTGSGARS